MRKHGLLALITISTIVLTTACGGSEGASYDSGTSSFYQSDSASKSAGWDSSVGSSFSEDYSEGEMSNNEISDNNVESESSNVDGYDMSRKIVYTSNISIESKKYDEDIAAIQKLVSSAGGYLESTSQNGSAEYGNRYSNYTARIPSKKYEQFMNSVGAIGSLTSKNENVEDITSSYVDVQARLKSLNKKLERLQELEENAETIEDLLAIEDRINSVQYDIENYTAQMRLYDDKVDYCTVTIYVDEVATYSEVKKDTAWNRFAEAFVNSFAGFIAFLQMVVIALIYILPYALVAGVILIIVFFATKKKRLELKAKRKEKKASKEKNSAQGYKGPQYEEEKKE